MQLITISKPDTDTCTVCKNVLTITLERVCYCVRSILVFYIDLLLISITYFCWLINMERLVERRHPRLPISSSSFLYSEQSVLQNFSSQSIYYNKWHISVYQQAIWYYHFCFYTLIYDYFKNVCKSATRPTVYIFTKSITSSMTTFHENKVCKKNEGSFVIILINNNYYAILYPGFNIHATHFVPHLLNTGKSGQHNSIVVQMPTMLCTDTLRICN